MPPDAPPSAAEPRRPDAGRVVLIQLTVLGALCLAAFRGEVAQIFDAAASNRESAHALAAPLLIGLLAWRRRRLLAESLGRPSAWGVALLAAALLVSAAFAWPLNFAYVRRLAMVPALGGIVLAVCGPRTAMRCAPMLLVVLLSIDVPTRLYASLIIVPETFTLGTVRFLLELLPGVVIDLQGADLRYLFRGASGTIALGEPYRGASLILASLTLGAFVAFGQVRPWWQLALLAAAAIPVAMACNVARLAVWGLATILGGAGPLSPWPRTTATLVSLTMAYGLFALTALLLSRLTRPRA